MPISYSNIGRTVTLRAKLEDLTGQEKVNLFRDLMDALGITERFIKEPDQTARAQEIITEQWDQHWK